MLIATLGFILISFLQAFGAAPTPDNRSESHITSSAPAGGDHGDLFDDVPLPTTNHKRIASIRLYGCGPNDHLTKIELGYRDNRALDSTIRDFVSHGVDHGLGSQQLDLHKDEYVIQVAATTWRKNVGTFRDVYHTRIGSIDIYTNQGNRVKCGASWFGKDPVQEAKPEYWDGALLYLSGRSGADIDMLTAHWIHSDNF